MARRKRASTAAAKVRKALSKSNKNENENVNDEDTSESPSTEENQEDVPIVHKKFGEIRVKPPELGVTKTEMTLINGIVLPSVNSNESNSLSEIKVEENLTTNYENIISVSHKKEIIDMPPAAILDQIDGNSIAFKNVMKGIELLRTTFSQSLEIKEEPPLINKSSSCEIIKNDDGKFEISDELMDMETTEAIVDDSSSSTKEDDNKQDIKGDNIIRRSTRIRHIGILKQKEKVIGGSPDAEKPVKVKSRWRRSSELELHRPDSPGAVSPPNIALEPETEEELQARLAKEARETAEGMSTFVPITENEYRAERNICREAKKMNCDCVLSKEELDSGAKGCGDDCLNRMLFIECGQKCALGDRCTNKCFQRKSYGLCKIFKTEKKGFGLQAEKHIPANSFIMEYVGEVVDQKEFARRVKSYAKDEVKHFYFMALKGDTVIDATSKGNISRFINHSCDPNAETQKWTVNGELRIGFFTKRAVQCGEELTFDYKFQRYGKEAQRCYCEAAQCRGWIGENPDDDSDEESEEESEDEEEDEEDEEVEEEDVEGEDNEESKADNDYGDNAIEARSDLGMDVEAPKVKVKPIPKPRVRKVRIPKTPAEKKQGRGRGRRKKEEPVVEDLGLEEEIQRLTITGLKNRAHTLMLSRLMIRAEDWSMRSRILKLIRCGDEPCRRLFLDYHGLRFLYAWMQATVADSTDTYLRRLEILATLQTLPIPHKTMLLDSKILAIVEEWHGSRKAAPSLSPDGDSGESEPIKAVFPEIEGETSSSEIKVSPSDSPIMNSDKIEACDLNQNDLNDKVQTLAKTLLDSWSLLKEVFKIPKKERMEQMKEHEREADRGYRQSTSTKEDLDKLYRRYKIDRIPERGFDKGSRDRWEADRKRTKEGLSSSDPDWFRNNRCRRVNKEQRRQMFALQVLREDEAARHRLQQEELWSQHKARCEGLGLDPNVNPAMDPISGCPIFFDQNTRKWAPYPPFNPPIHHNNYPMPPNGMNTSMPYPMMSYSNMNGPYPTPSPSVHMTPIYQSTPPILYQSNIITLTPEPPPPEIDIPKVNRPPKVSPDAPALTPVPVDAPIRLPPRWKVSRDPRGYTYYYHIKQRIAQWEPPSWTEEEAREEALRTLAAEAESSSESSESETEEEVEEDEQEEMETAINETEISVEKDVMRNEIKKRQHEEDSDGEQKNTDDEGVPQPSYSPIEEPSQSDDVIIAKKETERNDNTDSPIGSTNNQKNSSSKRRVGLVQERIISPRYEGGARSDFKRYKENKLMLRKRKEEKRKAEKLKLKGEKVKAKSERRKRKRVKRAVPESSTDKKIKENFKLSIAGAIVSNLNAYRKLDCKKGRITSNDDFKHLARKLTHFVMVKELKHCQSVDDLQCNESVVVKARDFIKKYMSKFGREYERCNE